MDVLDARLSKAKRGGASFTRSNRLYRLTWQVVWLCLAAWTPPHLRAWRRLLLRLFGAKVASTANIYGSARIWSPCNLELGEFACIGPKANIYTMAPIRLGAFALVSQGAHLCAGTHDIDDPAFQLKARPIVIGAHAWIAAEAFVGPGVKVGSGAVLGARGCAFRDLASWTVYTGNPATVLRQRKRFSDSDVIR
jgi:putative colanic acid biosynthesis acetyltransferase WcaF